MADVPGPVLANVVVLCNVGADKYRTFRNRRRHEARCRMADSTKQSSSGVAKLALFLGILSTLLGIVSTMFTLYRTSAAGEVKVVKPLSGYALVRGINPDPGGAESGPFAISSDHIVLPLEWSNGTGTPILIKSPSLQLTELGENGKQLKFFLVGELPEMSIAVFENLNEKPPTFSNSVVVEPHSVKKTVSVFRVNNWDEHKCLRFHQGQNYKVELEYSRIPQKPRFRPSFRFRFWEGGSEVDQTSQPLVDNLPILKSANYLLVYEGWDYYSLLPGSRASAAEGLPEDATKHYPDPGCS